MYKVAYLAAPYSHPNPQVKQERLEIVNQVAAHFHARGEFVYSPLTHNTPLAKLTTHFNSWEAVEHFDKAMLMRCDELIVLRLPGWESSKGVSAEIDFAKQQNIPIRMIDLPDLS